MQAQKAILGVVDGNLLQRYKDRHAPPDPRIQVQEVSFDWGRPFEEALGPLNYGCEGVGDML